MKNLTVIAYEWFDKVNGNSYFAAEIFADNKLIALLPYQYGYGSHYQDMAMDHLCKTGVFTDRESEYESLWRYCERKDITLLTSKHENCLKRDLKAIGAQKVAEQV